MRHALGMHETDAANELQEIEVGDVLGHAHVGFDLVEQVAALGELHRDPSPDVVLARREPFYHVRVLADVRMQRHFHRNLLC